MYYDHDPSNAVRLAQAEYAMTAFVVIAAIAVVVLAASLIVWAKGKSDTKDVGACSAAASLGVFLLCALLATISGCEVVGYRVEMKQQAQEPTDAGE